MVLDEIDEIVIDEQEAQIDIEVEVDEVQYVVQVIMFIAPEVSEVIEDILDEQVEQVESHHKIDDYRLDEVDIGDEMVEMLIVIIEVMVVMKLDEVEVQDE